MAKKISGSVGKGGKNKPEDTRIVQELLNSVSVDEGNPAPSDVLVVTAPPTSVPESLTFAFPINDEFLFDPGMYQPARSIAYQLDVLPTEITGTSQIDITLAIVQGELFIASRADDSPSVDGTETGWTTLGQTGLQAEDFVAYDGGPERPDFSQPFQFGYAFVTEPSTTALSIELGLDNMEATIYMVPEPISITLALAMGASLLWHRWWSNGD